MADTKTKKSRKIKPVYIVVSIADGSGGWLGSDSFTIHSTHKDSDALLEAMDAGTLPVGSFYKRIALD